MNVEIESSWKEQLAGEFEKDYFKELCDNVDRAYKDNQCFPPINLLFNAFNLCPFHNVKVVIIGQDPYPREGQAHGLSFSFDGGKPFPRSLNTIFKAISDDFKTPLPTNGKLTRWAEQGVLLLNSILTVQEKKPASHRKFGWECFTDAVIERLNDEREGLVFMLWGVKACKKASLIDADKHLVLTSAHPSPRAVNFGCSFGKKHFSQANEFLRERGKSPINW
jgi:uracil-DNA glycosylase